MDKIFRNTPKFTATDWLIDAVIAAGAFGFCCLQLTVAVNLLIPDEFMRRLMGIQAMVPSGLSLLAIALTTLPLVLRRKCPWAVFVWCLVSWGLLQAELNGIALSVAGPLIALFTLASARSRAEAAIACAVMCLVLLFAPAPPEQSRILTQLTVFQNMALALAAAFAGYALHEHQERTRAIEERAIAAERSREAEARRRVEAERVSIAREVHDITAHSLSAVSIQAAAAERLVDRDPAAAKEAIAEVRRTAKGALEEIRAMIGVLRAEEGPAETTPTQGTDRMGDLVSYLEGADIEVTLDETAYDRRSSTWPSSASRVRRPRISCATPGRAVRRWHCPRNGRASPSLSSTTTGEGSLPRPPRPVTTACSACASARGFYRARSPRSQVRSAACALP